MPYGSRRAANIDAQNAIGAVTDIMLGPSHVSGCPQQNLAATPRPTSGIPLRMSAIPDSEQYGKREILVRIFPSSIR